LSKLLVEWDVPLANRRYIFAEYQKDVAFIKMDTVWSTAVLISFRHVLIMCSFGVAHTIQDGDWTSLKINA
jgi:hypothetical protein